MGKIYPGGIEGRLREFILAQPVFFVATAPEGPGGHINISPKGMRGTAAVLGPHRFAYLDFTGSGIETVAHLRENGRITVMFCAFSGPPNIVRLHGHGEAVFPGDERFPALRAAFADRDDHGLRAVVVVDVERVSDSCGYAVPYLDYVGERDLLDRWAHRKSAADLLAYRAAKNAVSIDGLPALEPGSH